ncbi:MAG: TonB-dependent receptor [Bacteroidetes bacterium]|nr:TonB-dependent receptor [Bacteroidota bacterium]
MNRTKIILFSLLLLHTYTSIVAQSTLVQNIKGKVIDAETKTPLFGATIVIADDSTSNTLGGVTDYDGNYKIAKVPVGRHRIAIRCLGYKETVLSNIVVSSAKEMVLNVELQARIMDIKEITVSAGSKADVINEMATVSARTFTVEETQRYAGSRDDAARMASNFAGVQGGDDSRNDIVIRGNSPWGVLWKLDGVDIVNPNHFAVPGTTGSAINLLNSKTFANSDFMTGAFPAEYGNAIAGGFDLRLRNGNNEHHEFTAQLGFLGTELLAEGPISRTNGSSYLATYRYSTFQVFSALSIPIGTSAVPKYQDGTIKINLPTKRAGNFTIFGVGGKSDIEILVSDKTEPTEEIYGDKDRDQYFGSLLLLAVCRTLYLWVKTLT